MTDITLPSLFVPHGAPTFALAPGEAGAALARLGAQLPVPRAIVVVSPHWATPAPAVGLAAWPQTIHDFSGFPAPLYALRYTPPGAPQIAASVMARLREAGFAVRGDATRGLDHGAWVPLRFMFPEARVPVIPLSIQPQAGPAHHLALGAALAPLAAEGVLVVASGNLTHNLQDYFHAETDAPPAYVRQFADWVGARLAAGDVEALLQYRRHAPFAARAHPDEHHLLPLFVAMGAGGQARRFYAGTADRVLAMDAFVFETVETAERISHANPAHPE